MYRIALSRAIKPPVIAAAIRAINQALTSVNVKSVNIGTAIIVVIAPETKALVNLLKTENNSFLFIGQIYPQVFVFQPRDKLNIYLVLF